MDQTKVSTLAATGVAGLDLILGGGLPRDRVYLLQGDPGVGKTTLALQFLLEGRRLGEKGLYVTLGESEAELRGVAESHGWSLEGIEVLEVSTGEDQELRGDENYDVFHPSEVELEQVMKTLIAEAEKASPRRVVIDSLSEVRLLARDPLRFRRQFLALKRFFVSRGCTVLLLDAAATSKIGDLQSNTLVHGVLMMEQNLPDFGLKRRRLTVVKLRGVRFDDGYHDYKVETGGINLYPRHAVAKPDRPEPKGPVLSGMPELDTLLGGGLAWGSSTLLLGAAGAGKSTLSSAYASAAAARGEGSVIYTFDESEATLLARADSIGLRLSEHVQAGLVRVVPVDPGQLAPGEFAQMVRESCSLHGARIVVIDSLNGYLAATPDERFLIVQLHELLTYLGEMGVCTLLVLAQHGLIGHDVTNTIDASYLADSVIMLRYFEHAGQVRKAISVLKKRAGPHEHTIREFQIVPGRIRVGEPLTGFQGVLSGTPTYAGGGRPLFGTGGGNVAGGADE